jgi:hypothetical protein
MVLTTWQFNLHGEALIRACLLWLVHSGHHRQHDPVCQPGAGQPGCAGAARRRFNCVCTTHLSLTPRSSLPTCRCVFFQVCLLCANGFSATSGQTKSLICDKMSVAMAGDFPTSTSPTVDLNAIKNATEIEGFRASQIRWGTALV